MFPYNYFRTTCFTNNYNNIFCRKQLVFIDGGYSLPVGKRFILDSKCSDLSPVADQKDISAAVNAAVTAQKR